MTTPTRSRCAVPLFNLTFWSVISSCLNIQETIFPSCPPYVNVYTECHPSNMEDIQGRSRPSPPFTLQQIIFNLYLKVLTNEKRGGLTVVSFDRSPVQLFSLWFLYKSMKAPSCERPKTNQRTLFLSFAINNCYPTSGEKLLAIFEFILEDFSTM